MTRVVRYFRVYREWLPCQNDINIGCGPPTWSWANIYVPQNTGNEDTLGVVRNTPPPRYEDKMPTILGKRKMRVRIPSVTKGPLILGRFETDSFLVQKLVVDPADERNKKKTNTIHR